MGSCLTILPKLTSFCICILLKIENWVEGLSYIRVNSVATDVAEALLTKSLTNSMELTVKITHPQLINEHTAFYGTQRFITTFTTAHPYPEPDQTSPCLPSPLL
jgi:hypothetical protein